MGDGERDRGRYRLTYSRQSERERERVGGRESEGGGEETEIQTDILTHTDTYCIHTVSLWER
jgi:hypothetical protein